jgi:hypothetical protein
LQPASLLDPLSIILSPAALHSIRSTRSPHRNIPLLHPAAGISIHPSMTSSSSSRTRTPTCSSQRITRSLPDAASSRRAVSSKPDPSYLNQTTTLRSSPSLYLSSCYPSTPVPRRTSPMTRTRTTPLFRWRNIHLCILFLVSVIISTDVTFSGLVSAEPFPYSEGKKTSFAPSAVQSKRSTLLVRRSQIWAPPEGATPYELPSHQQDTTSPTPARPQTEIINVMSKAKSSKNSTTSSPRNPNIISVPLQDLASDTLVRPFHLLRRPFR